MRFEGIAKPMVEVELDCRPVPLVSASVGMPTILPSRSTSAPPLLPGASAALVWISPVRIGPAEKLSLSSVSVRLSALMMPKDLVFA
jgi:hypothetical protein